jgi:hypothetical protein
MKLNKLFVGFAISLTASVSGNTASSTYVPLNLPGVCNSAFTKQPSWENYLGLLGGELGLGNVISSFTPISMIGSTIGLVDDIGNLYNPPGTNNKTMCLQGMLSEINTEFQAVLSQIRQIQTNMNLNDTFIMKEINENSGTDLRLAYLNYIEQIANIIGEENYQTIGAYQNFINIIGFEQTGDAQGSIPDLLTDLAKSQLLAAAYEDNSDALQQAFFNISGVEFNRDDCDSAPQTCVSYLKPAALQSDASGTLSASPLINVLQAARAYLYTKISSTLSANVSLKSKKGSSITDQQNIVNLYPPYNKFIISLFHQSLAAITASYYMLKEANIINALKAANAGFLISDDDYYMPEVVYIPGAYYKPIPIGSNTLAETQAQNKQQLDQAMLYLDTFYAGLVNQMYENILSYIVTDGPVTGQLSGNALKSWPASSNNILYKSTIDGQTEYWTMPNAVDVDGYACLEASGSDTRPVYTEKNGSLIKGKQFIFTNWNYTQKNYDQCYQAYQNQSDSLKIKKNSTNYYVSGIADPSSINICYTNDHPYFGGCYLWQEPGQNLQGTGVYLGGEYIPWGEKPPGATVVNTKALMASDIENIAMPDETIVSGYACLKAVSTYSASPIQFTNWENQNLSYKACASKYLAQDSKLSANIQSNGQATAPLKSVDCINSGGNTLTTGCYIWGELTTESTDDTYAINTYTPWGQTPPGGQSKNLNTSSLELVIQNQINYNSIIAANVFKPSNNPPPVSGPYSGPDAPGSPFFQLNDALSETTFIYQSPAIREVNQCLSAYITAAESSTTISAYLASDSFYKSCPSFFPAQYLLTSGSLTTTPPPSNGETSSLSYASTSPVISTMTGGPSLHNDDDSTSNEIFAPMHYDASTGTVKQYGKMYGVISGCQSSSELYTYIPTSANTIAQKGVPYISCGLWISNDITQVKAANTEALFNNEATILSGLNLGNMFSNGYTLSTLYNEPYITNGSSGYQQTTEFTFTSPIGPSDPPAITKWFISDTTFTPKPTGTADPYFNGSGLQIPLITPTNTCGADCTNLTYTISAGGLTKNDSVVHGIALNYQIDGFVYPLVLFMYHDANLAGNGFFVVQNAVLNNVGFINASGNAVPISGAYNSNDKASTNAWQVPFAAGILDNPVDDAPAPSVATASIQYNNLNIAENYLFTIVNGLVFYINGDNGSKFWSHSTVDGVYFAWYGSSIHIEYGAWSD